MIGAMSNDAQTTTMKKGGPNRLKYSQLQIQFFLPV